MLASFRSALLMVAALTATIIAPAKAGPSGEPPLPASNTASPKVSVSELMDPNGVPVLSQPQADEDTSANSTDVAVPAAVKPTGDLAEMVAQLRSADTGSHELDCLATGVYFESKSEPLAGQLAVGKVIANRTQSGRFPTTYCGVLFQRGQFSFVHGHVLPTISHANRQWQTAVAIAKIVDEHLKESAAGDALFFHARYVSPGWHAKRVASIGNHVFYR